MNTAYEPGELGQFPIRVWRGSDGQIEHAEVEVPANSDLPETHFSHVIGGLAYSVALIPDDMQIGGLRIECECRGYTHRKTCRHVTAVAEELAKRAAERSAT